MKVDPITLAVIESALDEMAYAVIRTTRSEIIKDVMDYPFSPPSDPQTPALCCRSQDVTE